MPKMKAVIFTEARDGGLLREEVSIEYVESNDFGGHVVEGYIAFGNRTISIVLNRELAKEIALHLIGHECENRAG